MTIEEFHAMNPEARPHGRGYRGPCPSCGGKQSSSKFSFTERDGKIMVHCFAGCSVAETCEALGIELKDLFFDSGLSTEQRRALPPRPKRVDWRRYSSNLEFASEHHWLRADAIFTAARNFDVSVLDPESLDAAWECLAIGFNSLQASENLGRAACGVRVKGLLDEAQRNKRKAAA